MPREHGAYGQFALPLVAALASARPSIASGLFAAAATGVFLSHEPALIVLGQRGARALREVGPRARRRLAGLVLASTFCGATALILAPAARPAAALSALLAISLAPFVAGRREKTLAGELVAAGALPSACLPVLAAESADLATALQVWGAWALGFAASTAAVRAIIATAKGSSESGSGWALALPPALAVSTAALGAPAVLTGAPLLLSALALRFARPSTKRLRQVGWVLVAASVVTAVATVCLVRAAQS